MVTLFQKVDKIVSHYPYTSPVAGRQSAVGVSEPLEHADLALVSVHSRFHRENLSTYFRLKKTLDQLKTLLCSNLELRVKAMEAVVNFHCGNTQDADIYVLQSYKSVLIPPHSSRPNTHYQQIA